jgi:hypothetical protein
LAIVASVVLGLAAYSDASVANNDNGGTIQVHKYLPKDNPSQQAPWTNQGNGQSQWTFNIYNNADLAAGHLVGSGSQLGSNIAVPLTELWVTESPAASFDLAGFFLPDGDGDSGNDKCNQRDATSPGVTPTLHIEAAAWQTKGNHTGVLHVCAYNRPAPSETVTVTVCKVIQQNNDGVDQSGSFNFTATGSSAFSLSATEGVTDPPASQCHDVTVPNGGSVSITEASGGAQDRPGTWNADAAGYPKYRVGSGALTEGASVTFSPLDDTTVIFHNASTATPPANGFIIVHKQKTADSPNDITTGFGGTIDGSLPWTLTGIGGTSAAVAAAPGSHNVVETSSGNGWTPATYNVAIIDAAGQCPVGLAAYTATSVTVVSGETTHVCVLNQKQAQVVLRTLDVQKVILGSAPDNAAVFSGWVSSLVYLPWSTTNGVPVTVANNLAPGAYSVHENAKAGYALAGFATVYGAGAQCPAGPTPNGTAGMADLSGNNTAALVCVYNDPRVSITAYKIEVSGGNESPGHGWKVSLAGCRMPADTHPTGGTDGSYTWSDVPPCSAYTVSEDPDSKPGQDFHPSGPTSVVVNATTVGQTYTVTFRNVKVFTCYPGCIVPKEPTQPTPEATALPVTPPPPTPTAPPVTPTDVVVGARTPGPPVTPIAPSTGSGMVAASDSSNAIPVMGGFLALASGLAAVAITKGSRR